MFPIKTVLVPTDFSEPSEHAVRMAGALARDYGARVILLHVMEPPVYYGEMGMSIPAIGPFENDVREDLERLAALNPGVSIERRMVEGYSAREVLRCAEETKCDLIVIGSHGRSGLSRVLLGSVAEEITRHAPCPVLIVKTGVAAPAHEPATETGTEAIKT